MKIFNLNKILKYLFLIVLIIGIVVFAVKGQFRFFEGNDSIMFKPISEIPDGVNIDDEFNSLINKFSIQSISSIDRNSKELKIVGFTESQAREVLGDQGNFELVQEYPTLNQSNLKAEFITISTLIGVYTVGYIFVLKLRKINIRFKTFSIFAIKVILLFIIQTISFIGLMALISRVYEIKILDLYSILVLNLVTSFMFIKLTSSETFSSLAGLYLDIVDLIKNNKGNLLKIAILLTIFLPFGFGIKIVSTLLFILLAIFFSVYSLELYNRANIEGARLALPNRDSVTSMVRSIRIRNTPFMSPKASSSTVSSKNRKKTETKKKRKKEKNKNRR